MRNTASMPHRNAIMLYTERLVLRDHVMADLETHHALLSDAVSMAYLGDIKTNTVEESRDNLIQAIEQIDRDKRERYFLRIENRRTGVPAAAARVGSPGDAGYRRRGSLKDILFHTDDYIFSYRVAGILIMDNHILLQKPTNDKGYAFPGGHVSFGETHEETLKREFKEETGYDIHIKELKWVGEVFFSWGNKRCQQICLYYSVGLNTKLQSFNTFVGNEHVENRDFKIEFHWMPVDELDKIMIYPTNTVDLLKGYNGGVQHFIYREKEEYYEA